MGPGFKITMAGPDHPIYRNGWTVGATRLPDYQCRGQSNGRHDVDPVPGEEPAARSPESPATQADLVAGGRWNGYDPVCIEAFKLGDRVGLPFEGCTMFLPVDERRLEMALKSSQGSDESSIVDCFLRFADGYPFSTREQFAWDWVTFHAKHHGTGYGRTYKDHFNLVAHIRKNAARYPDTGSRVRKLTEIAADADSFGNGCLALVYPAFCYARFIGQDPVEFVRYLTGFTHANRNAIEAVTLLCHFVECPQTIADFYADSGISDDVVFRNRYCTGHASALNTLMTAVKCSIKGTWMGVIRAGLRIGGDTDSTLATAMLLWTLKHNEICQNGGHHE